MKATSHGEHLIKLTRQGWVNCCTSACRLPRSIGAREARLLAGDKSLDANEPKAKAWASWHLPTALDSARSLRALQPSRLAVGHGKVLEAPTERMGEAIAEAERKLKR